MRQRLDNLDRFLLYPIFVQDCNKTASWDDTSDCMVAKVAERILAEGSGVECMPFSYKGILGRHVGLPDCEEEEEASRTLRKVYFLW